MLGLARLVKTGAVIISSVLAAVGFCVLMATLLLCLSEGTSDAFVQILKTQHWTWAVPVLVAVRLLAFARALRRTYRQEHARLSAFSKSERRYYWCLWGLAAAFITLMVTLCIVLKALSSLPADQSFQFWYSGLTFGQNCANVLLEVVFCMGMAAAVVWLCWRTAINAPQFFARTTEAICAVGRRPT
jgi:hypothetical protein